MFVTFAITVTTDAAQEIFVFLRLFDRYYLEEIMGSVEKPTKEQVRYMEYRQKFRHRLKKFVIALVGT